jgi:hypothetical protein
MKDETTNDETAIEDLCERVTPWRSGQRVRRRRCGANAFMSCPSCARRFCYECAVEHVRDCAGREAPDAEAS